MKSPGILNGIIVAVIIAAGAAVASLILGGFLLASSLGGLIVSTASLVYLLYLLKSSNARIGRVVVISSWAGVCLMSWLFNLPLLEQILIHAGLIWLVRSLYFHSSIFTAMLDFGLVSAGLAMSAWAMINTGSLVAAVWSFFLVQALFCWLPELARKQNGEAEQQQSQHSSFQSAHRVALDAVRKLAQS